MHRLFAKLWKNVAFAKIRTARVEIAHRSQAERDRWWQSMNALTGSAGQTVVVRNCDRASQQTVALFVVAQWGHAVSTKAVQSV
jgi:poly(3-hydroxybutyrate) depolymerase